MQRCPFLKCLLYLQKGEQRVTEANEIQLIFDLEGIFISLAGRGDLFVEFVTLYFSVEKIEIEIEGLVDAKIATSLGNIELKDLNLRNLAVLDGMGGLRNSYISKLEFAGVQSLFSFWESQSLWVNAKQSPSMDDLPFDKTSKGIELFVVTTLVNPSKASVVLGNVCFLLMYSNQEVASNNKGFIEDAPIGILCGKRVMLKPTESKIELKGLIVVDDDSKSAVSSFFSSAISNLPYDLSTKVFPSKSQGEYLYTVHPA